MSIETVIRQLGAPRSETRSAAAIPGGAETVPRFSLIVPCYNEEGAIARTIAELRKSLPNTASYELVVVNDGSTDRTAEILGQCQAEDSGLRVITHARNLGYGAALKTGIRTSKADLIAITDADGTYPHDRLLELVVEAEWADMAVGARVSDDVHYPVIRRIPKVFLTAYAHWIAQQPIPDLNSGMRVFRRSVAERFLNILPDGFSFTTTITLAMLTNRYAVRFVPIGYSHRIGKSKVRPIKDTLRFFQLILRTGMYFAPLRIFAPALIFFFLAFSASLSYDVFVRHDLRETTLLLMVLFINSTMFALLADMIDKRSP
jgi:glycosyltransferase involved in cell wall biosynthesis